MTNQAFPIISDDRLVSPGLRRGRPESIWNQPGRQAIAHPNVWIAIPKKFGITNRLSDHGIRALAALARQTGKGSFEVGQYRNRGKNDYAIRFVPNG